MGSACPGHGWDGDFYGTTISGRRLERGTIFRITANGIYTLLHSFTGTDGSAPQAPLLQARDGDFYGTTQSGGLTDFCCGTVFKMTPDGTVTTLHVFRGYQSDDGSAPVAALMQATDGNFYGTTYAGGPGGAAAYLCGTICRLGPDGDYSILHTFTGGEDGEASWASLVQATDGVSTACPSAARV